MTERGNNRGGCGREGGREGRSRTGRQTTKTDAKDGKADTRRHGNTK